MNYIVVTKTSKSQLESEVIGYLLEGWELVGGVSISVILGNEKVYAQALIKK